MQKIFLGVIELSVPSKVIPLYIFVAIVTNKHQDQDFLYEMI